MLKRRTQPDLSGIPAARPSAGRRKIERRFVELFDELRLPLYRYLARAGLRPEEAEEIAQEAFLRLFKHLLERGQDENLRGWVFRVAHNLAIDQRRDRNRLMTKSLEERGKLSDLLTDPAQDPEQLLLRKEKTAGIDRAIRSLPHRQWQCLSLRLKGFGYREIGEILGVGVSAVAESLRRAVEKLQKMNRHGERESGREQKSAPGAEGGRD
jgi:RNA polymerase sigma-70 factor (ECF subfamily)